MKKIGHERKLRRALRKHRRNVVATIATLTEKRRALAEQERKLHHSSAHKRKRTPKSPERQTARTAELARMHDELMKLGEELQTTDARLGDLQTRLGKLGSKLKRVGKVIRHAVRLDRNSGPDAAIRAAQKDSGKHEEPLGSNWGGIVTKMIQFTGYSGPVYWCGCAACWWTIKKGKGLITSKIRRGYAGYVKADAEANTNGLRKVPKPVKGGLATLWNLEHVVMTTGRISDDGLYFETCEGNTSDAGSQSNGDSCSAGKWRLLSDADVFAAQAYPS